MDEDFYDESEISAMMSEKSIDNYTLLKIQKKLINDGYRTRKQIAEDIILQTGFDCGYNDGMGVGLVAGKLYAACRLQKNHPNYNIAIQNIEHILLHSLAANGKISGNEVHNLKQSITSISDDNNSLQILLELLSKLETASQYKSSS